MITLFEVMKITTEPSKGGCVVSTHEFVMGYTPLQRTRKGNKIGPSKPRHCAAFGRPLGERPDATWSRDYQPPHKNVVRGSGFYSGGDNSYELFFLKFAEFERRRSVSKHLCRLTFGEFDVQYA